MSLLLNHIFRERSLSFITWIIYLTNNFFVFSQCRSRVFGGSKWKHVFAHSQCKSSIYICGCTWSWSWEHDKSLNKGQQDLTKTQHKVSSICGKFVSWKIIYGFGRKFLPLRSMWHYGFMTFLSKTKSPSTLNRKGRISKP